MSTRPGVSLVAAALAIATGSGSAQQARVAAVPASPAQVPLAAVDRYVRDEIRRERVPGVSVAVVRGGKIILARGYGEANVELHAPATDSTVYQSGSVGKQFTAALILRLAAAGRLGLDDPIRRHLPEGPPAWDSITIRHLLTHTSGIADYTDSSVSYQRAYTEDELVRIAARLPLQFRAGDHWRYSNTGYLLLGAIVRRVTGVFYGDLLRQEIFAPLGMRTARIISEADIVPNRAAGYELEHDSLHNQAWVNPSLNTTADGALYLTVHDLARWVIGWDEGRVLSAGDRETAWTPVRLNDGSSYAYGFGWELTELRAHRRIGHTGSWQGFRTSIQRFPAQDLTVIVLANLDRARPEAMSLAIAGLLAPALVPPHRLPAPLPGPRPPVPIDSLLRRVIDDSDSVMVTPQLHHFLGKAERDDWKELASLPRWTQLGCERPTDHPIVRLGSPVAWLCYARGEGPAGGTAITAFYTEDWHAADIEGYGY
ncbi:MAG TPA: serine hydrolase domain-containing protein [Gemmatimonadales bacterium]|nr:serine hydrolase domain-containing protein [Gemmatimonadales bacterium]